MRERLSVPVPQPELVVLGVKEGEAVGVGLSEWPFSLQNEKKNLRIQSFFFFFFVGPLKERGEEEEGEREERERRERGGEGRESTVAVTPHWPFKLLQVCVSVPLLFSTK